MKTTRQEKIIRIGGDQRVSGRQDGEAEEHEGAYDVVAILAVFGQRQDDVAAQQLLFGVLEQGDEPFLGSGLDEARRHLEVKALAPEGALPAPIPRRRQFHDEHQARRCLVRHFHQLGALPASNKQNQRRINHPIGFWVDLFHIDISFFWINISIF